MTTLDTKIRFFWFLPKWTFNLRHGKAWSNPPLETRDIYPLWCSLCSHKKFWARTKSQTYRFFEDSLLGRWSKSNHLVEEWKEFFSTWEVQKPVCLSSAKYSLLLWKLLSRNQFVWSSERQPSIHFTGDRLFFSIWWIFTWRFYWKK